MGAEDHVQRRAKMEATRPLMILDSWTSVGRAEMGLGSSLLLDFFWDLSCLASFFVDSLAAMGTQKLEVPKLEI